MRLTARKSAPGVRNGKTQKQNRTALSPDFYEHEFENLVIKRLRPAKGYFHAVGPTDVRRMISLIPDWDEISTGLKAIILTPGDDYCYGRYNNVGLITLDAWPKEGVAYFSSRKEWLLRSMGLDAPPETESQSVRLSRDQARCFLLLGTFLHEIGHHLDRMATRSQADASNGEPAAIAYEKRRQRQLWDAYLEEFGIPEA